MRIVITGATGNVGTAVLRRLHRVPGLDLVGVSRRRPDTTQHPYDDVNWRELDLGDDDAEAQLREVFDGADAVIHLAWRLQPNHDEPEMQRTNVRGLRNVVLAAVDAGVPQLCVISSVGAYSPGPKTRAVDESWPTGGTPSSQYGRQKAANERMLDALERTVPGMVVTRIRPGLVMHDDAAAEVADLFLGPHIPTGWLRRIPLPVLPLPAAAVSQVVDADDLADAIWRAVDARAGGAFNVASDPVVDPHVVARVMHSRWVAVSPRLLRPLIHLAWRLRIVAVDPGWLDLATSIPVMDTDRVRTELGWRPRVPADVALGRFVDAVAARRSLRSSPALRGR